MFSNEFRLRLRAFFNVRLGLKMFLIQRYYIIVLSTKFIFAKSRFNHITKHKVIIKLPQINFLNDLPLEQVHQ
jgi:hypothetical protein